MARKIQVAVVTIAVEVSYVGTDSDATNIDDIDDFIEGLRESIAHQSYGNFQVNGLYEADD